MAGLLSDVDLCGNRKGMVSEEMVLKIKEVWPLSHLISSHHACSLGVPLLLFQVNARNLSVPVLRVLSCC